MRHLRTALLLLCGLMVLAGCGSSAGTPSQSLPRAYPNDPYFPKQWNLHNTGQDGGKPGADIHILDAWKITRCSPKITIAVLDTGIDMSNPEFKNKIVWPKNFGNSPYGIEDKVGHGTAVSAIAAANTNNGRGIAAVCPQGHIMPVKVGGDNGRFSPDLVDQGIMWAVRHGARVINMSFGSNLVDVSPDVMGYATAHHVVMIAATMNDGKASDNFPANFPGVLAVGGTDRYGRRWRHAGYGPLNYVLAPAADVPSILPGGDDVYAVSGDSFAAPQVSGLAALILSIRPDLSPDDIYNAIVTGADHVVGQHGFNTVDGYGRIDCYRSLKVAEAMPRPKRR